MEATKNAQARPTPDLPAPDVVAPAGMESEQRQKPVEPARPEGVTFRKLDSEDIARLKGVSLIPDGFDEKKNQLFRTDVGAAQKAVICLAVKSAPWFSDVVDERHGVTDEIWQRRSRQEFRRMPVHLMDKIYKEADKFNNFAYRPEELEGK